MKNKQILIAVILSMLIAIAVGGAASAEVIMNDSHRIGKLNHVDARQETLSDLSVPEQSQAFFELLGSSVYESENGYSFQRDDTFGYRMLHFYNTEGEAYCEDLTNVVKDEDTVVSEQTVQNFHCEGCGAVFSVTMDPEDEDVVSSIDISFPEAAYNGVYAPSDRDRRLTYDTDQDFASYDNFFDVFGFGSETDAILFRSKTSNGGYRLVSPGMLQTSMIVLEGIFDTPNENSFLPIGEFPINNSGNDGTFLASSGIVNGELTGSYAGIPDSDGSMHAPFWFFTGGTVKIETPYEDEPRQLQLTINAVTSTGRTVEATVCYFYQAASDYEGSVGIMGTIPMEDGFSRYQFSDEDKNSFYFGALPDVPVGTSEYTFNNGLDYNACGISIQVPRAVGSRVADLVIKLTGIDENYFKADISFISLTDGSRYHLTYQGINAARYSEISSERFEAVSALSKAMGKNPSDELKKIKQKAALEIYGALGKEDMEKAGKEGLEKINKQLYREAHPEEAEEKSDEKDDKDSNDNEVRNDASTRGSAGMWNTISASDTSPGIFERLGTKTDHTPKKIEKEDIKPVEYPSIPENATPKETHWVLWLIVAIAAAGCIAAIIWKGWDYKRKHGTRHRMKK